MPGLGRRGLVIFNDWVLDQSGFVVIIGTLSIRTGEDDDSFREVKLLIGRALRMSQRLHNPILRRIQVYRPHGLTIQ